MPKKVGGLEQLLVQELQDLFDAEKQLVRSLPKMAKAARDEELGDLFREHLEVTKNQVRRLEQVFALMEMPARSKPCKGMKGIVEEGQEMLSEHFDEGIMDSAIASGGRKVEHYEIVSYEAARGIAQRMGMSEAAQLLDQTLAEEIDADRRLLRISKRLVKSAPRAQAMQAEKEERPRARRASGQSRSRHAAGGRSQTGRAQVGRSQPKTRSASARAGSRGAAKASRGGRGHAAHPLTDPEEIRSWAEERGAKPSCVRGTGGRGDTGMIRLDFPGYSGRESLEEISWDDWFEKFESNNLALMVQDETSGGQKSNFNKIVSRESIEGRKQPKVRAAR